MNVQLQQYQKTLVALTGTNLAMLTANNDPSILHKYNATLAGEVVALQESLSNAVKMQSYILPADILRQVLK